MVRCGGIGVKRSRKSRRNGFPGCAAEDDVVDASSGGLGVAIGEGFPWSCTILR